MENSSNECPTEILIDLNECDFIPSHVNYKEIQTPLDSQKSMKYLEDALPEAKQEKYQCIMDMSPFKLKKKCSDLIINSSPNSEQISKGSVDDCPTAVLIEVPNSSSMCSKQYPVLKCNKNDCYQEDAIVKCHKKQECIFFFGEKKCRVIEESDNPYDFTALKNELSPPRPRWKTPSPQSMSRISREASRFIHNLNTSALLDEDSPLCEEILPLPINFDLDENSDQENFIVRTENSAVERSSNHKSVIIETEEEETSPQMISKEVSDISSSVFKKGSSSSEFQHSLTQSPSESFKYQMNIERKEHLKECNITLDKISSLESQSCSLGNCEISVCIEETDDVFVENNFSSEDKENRLKREEREILPSKALTRCKAAENITSASKKEMKNRRILSNLLNVKSDINALNSPNTKNINVAHNLKQNNKLNSKEFVYHGKQLLMKSTSEGLRTIPKRMSFSSSLQYGSSRESLSSFQKPNSVQRTTSLLSECKSSSSDVKNALTQMRTPSRRYSVAAPLRSASIKKPALSSFQNPPVPRFTPQSAGGTHSSFSKSWQHPNVSNSKVSRCQNSVSSAIIKPSHNRIYTPNTTKQAVIQRSSKLFVETSKNISVSTSSKNRFSSKLSLPSPLLAGQERKLARALFPSKPPK